jgi:hypothetical protein
MVSMTLYRTSLLAGAILATAFPALAADFNFNLAGHTADTAFSHSAGYATASLPLVNSDDAAGLLPTMLLSTGNTLSFILTLDAPLTVPASALGSVPYVADFHLTLQDFQPGPGSAPTVFYTTTFTFFKDGVAVHPNAVGGTNDGGCGGGGFCLDSVWNGSTSAFSFTSLAVTATVTGIFGRPGENLGTVTLLESPVSFSYAVTAVPEPGTAALVPSGLAVMLLMRRRRARR